MKKFKSVFALVIMLAVASVAKAQSVTPQYFAGTWEVLIKGTPQGDVKLPMTFEVADGKITGKVTSPESNETAPMTSVELKGEELFAYFTAGGYDVSMVISRKDDDNFTGKLMDMLDVEGKRVK